MEKMSLLWQRDGHSLKRGRIATKKPKTLFVLTRTAKMSSEQFVQFNVENLSEKEKEENSLDKTEE